jgi:hypothetical protein
VPETQYTFGEGHIFGRTAGFNASTKLNQSKPQALMHQMKLNLENQSSTRHHHISI